MAKTGDIKMIEHNRNIGRANNSLSVQMPTRVQQLSNNYYNVTRAPTDCIYLAITDLFATGFNLVVSEINNAKIPSVEIDELASFELTHLPI
jgi:broad specificity polyphosphatase/5'/3'-nucleotidase SurE